MATIKEPIHFEKKGYGRGLILGLTLAESMLLLVFCLLLIAGAIFDKQQSQIAKAERDLAEEKAIGIKLDEQKGLAEKVADELRARLDSAQAQLTAIAASRPDTELISEDWRELVAQVKEIQATGMSLDQISDIVPSLVVLKDSEIARAPPAEREALLRAALNALEKIKEQPKGHDWPPIINLSEADGNYFRVGSAKLSESFAAKLSGEITDQLAKLLDEYKVDLIEVVGHTDEQPLAGLSSNLDQHVYPVLTRTEPIEILKPGDNAGLGLARAIAVRNVLAAQSKLRRATILPYSAAQLIVPGDSISSGLSGDVESRRRIEIRVRRRSSAN